MMKFNLKKKEDQIVRTTFVLNCKIESLQQELNRKLELVSQLELQILTMESKPKLSFCNVTNQNILPVPKSSNLTYSRPTLISILPESREAKIHPHVIEAAKAIYGKTPDQLTEEEREHFAGYRQWKMDRGEPIEEDSLYQPT